MDVETVRIFFGFLIAFSVLVIGIGGRSVLLISLGIGSLLSEVLYMKEFPFLISGLTGGVVAIISVFILAYVKERGWEKWKQ